MKRTSRPGEFHDFRSDGNGNGAHRLYRFWFACRGHEVPVEIQDGTYYEAHGGGPDLSVNNLIIRPGESMALRFPDVGFTLDQVVEQCRCKTFVCIKNPELDAVVAKRVRNMLERGWTRIYSEEAMLNQVMSSMTLSSEGDVPTSNAPA